MADLLPVMMLGKKPPKPDPLIPMLARYTAKLPEAPPAVNWAQHGPADWGAMLNATLGDCTCAGVGHAIQTWTLNSTGEMVTLPDAAIESLYEKFGYNPAIPSTDQGAVETTVLKYWLANPVDGHALNGFVSLQPKDIKDIKDAIWLFGGAYIGLAMPKSAQGQRVWLVPPEGITGDGTPGSWGGHCVYVTGYDSRFVYFISWGIPMRMSWNFWWAYCDESYGLLAPDWLEASGMAPSVFDRAALEADMAALRQAA